MPTQNFGQSGQIGFVGPSRPGGKDQNKVIKIGRASCRERV